MENPAFEKRLKLFLEGSPDIFETLPQGVTLYSVSPVRADEWVEGYVPAEAGRWNFDGHPTKYFADSIATCLAELIGSNEGELSECICEHWRTTGPLRVLDIEKFPADLQRALFEKGGLPAEKWCNSHVLLGCLRLYPECSTVRAIKAPSPYGEALGIPGFTLATNPLETPFKLVRHVRIGCEKSPRA
jgi:hypothetical protein